MLFSRGIFENPWCALCQCEEESLLHTLRDCLVVRNFWILAGALLTQPDFFSRCCDEWLHTNSCSTGAVPNRLVGWNSFFLMGIWSIWLQRNRVCFQNGSCNPNFYNLMEQRAIEFACCVSNRSCPRPSFLIAVRWEPPSINWHKLNTDGSALGCPGPAGGGGLIRNHLAAWVKGFIRSIGRANSMEAELWEVRDGLALCTDLGLLAIELNVDSKAVVYLLSNNESSSAEFAPILDDCRQFMTLIPALKISHCFREANAYADGLAKAGSRGGQDFVLLETPPVEIIQLLFKDSSGSCLY